MSTPIKETHIQCVDFEHMCTNWTLVPRSNQKSNWLWPPLSRNLLVCVGYVDTCVEVALAMAVPIEIFDVSRWLCGYMCTNFSSWPRSNQNSDWLWPPLSRYLMMRVGYVDTCARVEKVSYSNQNWNWLWPPLSIYLMLRVSYINTCARIGGVGHAKS